MAAPNRPRRSNFFRVAFALVILVLACASFIGVKLWRESRSIAEIRNHLPSVPAKIPTVLAQRLTDATHRIESHATLSEGLAELGRLYHASGYAAEAETCWQLFRTLEPHDARSAYYLADLRRTANDQEGMLELLRETTRLAPNYAPAWLRLADALFKSDEIAEATAAYQKRLELAHDDPYALLGLARIELRQRQPLLARQRLERLVQVAPKFSPGHNLYAEILATEGVNENVLKHRWLGRETGRFRDADDPWLDELISWCFDYERLCLRGTVEFQSHIGDGGRSCFERAIGLRPDALTAYELLGNLDFDQGKPGLARQQYERGLARVPAAQLTAEYYARLSNACWKMQQPAEAARYAREGIARTGESPELYNELGVALLALDDVTGAVAAFDHAVALSSNDTIANYNLALVFINQQRIPEALAALHRAIELRPTYPDALELLAEIEIDAGHWRESLRYLQPLYEVQPYNRKTRERMASVNLKLGLEAEKQNDLASAAQHYAAGVGLAPDHPTLQARLGATLLALGQVADALAPLERFRQLDPQSPIAAFYLAECYAALRRTDDARRVFGEATTLAERAGDANLATAARERLQHLP